MIVGHKLQLKIISGVSPPMNRAITEVKGRISPAPLQEGGKIK